ncbi:phage holin family protein [Nibribacter ruber]|uniref:Phage holin family protein n=1 Tax=Nibribacter ruber TaxID=2698458 RepID=A0A6P1P4J5_9BACT|nr:phage holin family protein [Nibribacter ruber]
MNYLLDLLVSAGVLLLLAYILPQVTIKSFWTALWVAVLVGILNILIGWLLSFVLNLVTFFLLEFIVKVIVSAIVIKIADKLVRNFEIKGFWPALVIAVALSAASTLVHRSDEDEMRNEEYGFVMPVAQQEFKA